MWTGREFHPDDCMRIKGSNKLDEDQRKVLRAVNKLREGIAECQVLLIEAPALPR